MSSPVELDLFTRCLSGDRRARTELFKTYVLGSSRVRHLSPGEEYSLDFLHDCLNNLLRTGQLWDKQSSLAARVESVAAWTALEHQRRHGMAAQVAAGRLRLCAEIENSSEPPLAGYSPPSSGADDSPTTRILALLNEPERTVFRQRAVEAATWETVAAASGKPLAVCGAIFARALERVVRLCGAPPPLDDDLVPVFERVAADPSRPEGRLISTQLDSSFYAITPDMRKLGIATWHEARVFVLWNLSAEEAPPAGAVHEHLEACHYCADLLRAVLFLRQFLPANAPEGFRLCPGSFTLANSADTEEMRKGLSLHLEACPDCSDERAQVVQGNAPPKPSKAAPGGKSTDSGASAGKKIGWAAAVLLLLGAGSFAAYHFSAHPTAAPKSAASTTSEAPIPTVNADIRYKDLVQDVEVDDTKLLAGALPADRPAIKAAIDIFRIGDVGQTLSISSQLVAEKKDPSAQLLYAMSLYRTRLMTDGYREMQKAEAIPPRDSYRCWVMFQFALLVAEKDVFMREAKHLEDDPDYGPRVKKILEQVAKR